MNRPRSIAALMEALQKFPGVGPRTAQRMADAALEMEYDDALEISRAVLRVKKTIVNCAICGIHTERDPCDICDSSERDGGFICVVEEDEDVYAFERAGTHPGVYHVLGGVIKANKGVGPEKLRIGQLVERVRGGGVKEILIATDPSLSGETTAAYIIKLLKDTGVRITRPARGIPTGADLDYLDGETLSQAYRERKDIE